MLLRREKVISYFIKYVDEMDALSLREILPNGVFSTCFGHVEQQSYTVVLKVKKESTKNSHVQKNICYVYSAVQSIFHYFNVDLGFFFLQIMQQYSSVCDLKYLPYPLSFSFP